MIQKPRLSANADLLSSGLLGLAAVVAPIALGGTGVWTRLGLECAAALAVMIWAGFGAPCGRIALYPCLIVAVLGVQVLPLPEGLLSVLSPVAATNWKVAHLGMPGDWGRISLDPAATAAGIRRLLLAGATLIVVADLGRRKSNQRLLAAALSLVCVAIWGLGIVFPFDKNLVLLGFIDCKGPIAAEFWRTPLVSSIATNGSGGIDWVRVAGQRYQTASWVGADGFGPYIYGNHFAGAMCLTLPVALGCWLAFTRSRLPYIARHMFVAIVFGAGLWTVGVMATSRAGAASLLLSALVFASLSLPTSWLRVAVRLLTVGYATALVMFLLAMYGPFTGAENLFPDDLRPRIVALLNDGRAVAGRIAMRMFAASPLLGLGLGTYGGLFDRFLRGDLLLGYAHNDYAQWLAETGLVGAILAAPVAFALAARFRGWIQTAGGGEDPLGAGIWAAIAGIGFHTALDWNLHVPANALIACIVAGLALASGVRDSQPAPRGAVRLPWLQTRWPDLVLATGCFLAALFLARDAVSETCQRQLREAIVSARFAAMDQKKSAAGPALHDAIAAGERMFRWDPSNAQLALLIGQANLHLSAEPQPIDGASANLDDAEKWFKKARRNLAVSRGLPEPDVAGKPAGRK
jgi:O-antigen ligase